MGKALYRTHRPKKLAEVIGQDHITSTLGKALKTGQISHAYLFTGPRGTGKTSIARILAHEVNNLPYDDEQVHLDIIEIDAASNRRIDEIRELKDRINIAPTSAKYKVYIIDEVHMLTREAFNALLKTLEEPPEHAIFILATTEAHKLPETIVSRTQRFSFRPVTLPEVVGQLKAIATREKITVDNDALELIAQHGNGSFRDSISLLDQIRNTNDHVTIEHVRQALGQAPEEILNKLAEALQGNDMASVANLLQDVQEQGIQPAQLSEQLSRFLRQGITEGRVAPHSVIGLLKDLLTVPAAPNPHIALELALYEALLNGQPPRPAASAPSASSQPTPTPVPKADKPTRPTTAPAQSTSLKPTMTPPTTAAKPRKSTPTTVVDPVSATSTETTTHEAVDPLTPGDWQDILDAIKAKHNTLYGVVRMATPQFESGSVTLAFAFPFHHKRVSDSKNHAILSQIAATVAGHPIDLHYALDPTAKPPVPKPTSKKPAADISAITDVFGTAEVLD